MAVTKKKKTSVRRLANGRAKKSNRTKARKKSSAARKRAGRKAAGETDEKLEKVRDILFGAQARESEQQIASLEARLRKDAEAFRHEVLKRLDDLEGFIKAEASSLNKGVRSEQAERAAAVARLNGQLGKTTKSLRKKIAETDQRRSSAVRSLRKRVTEQSQQQQELMREAQAEITAAHESALEKLQADCIDRTTLAELFSELGARLKDL